MKRILVWFLVACLLLTGCGKAESEIEKEAEAPAWQEQFDLGMRYLNEENYEAAILAFTAVIEIDPNVVEAYLHRAPAYVEAAKELAEKGPEFLEATLVYLENAERDYLHILDLDDREDQFTMERDEVRKLLEQFREELAQPEAEDIFDERCWVLDKGPTLGSQYVLKFHADGTYHGYSMGSGERIDGTYRYDGNVLTLDGDLYDPVEEGCFQYRETHFNAQMGGEIHSSLSPDAESLWNNFESPEAVQENGFLGIWRAGVAYEGVIYYNEVNFQEDGSVSTVDYESTMLEMLEETGYGGDPASGFGTWKLVEQTGNTYLIEVELKSDEMHSWGKKEADGSYTPIDVLHMVIRMEIDGDSAQIYHHSGDDNAIYFGYSFERQETDLWGLVSKYH